MHRTEGDGFKVDPIGGQNVFADEDPPIRDATQLRYQEANTYQEEIANVILHAGMSLNTAAETIQQMVQLRDAINSLIAAQALVLSGIIDDHIDDATDAHDASAISNDSGVVGTDVADVLAGLDGRLSPITFIGSAEIVRVNAEIIMSLGSLWHGDYIDPYNINRCQYKQIGPDTCVINYNIHGRIIKTSPPSPYVNALEVNDSLTFPGLTTAHQDGLALIYIGGVMEVGARLSYLSGSDWITAFWRLSGEFPDNTPIIIHATATGKIAI